MEIFGGFMVMMSIVSLFLAVVWLIMPFVVFAIKGKLDRTLELLEVIDKRLTALETHLREPEPAVVENDPPVGQPVCAMASCSVPADSTADNI